MFECEWEKFLFSLSFSTLECSAVVDQVSRCSYCENSLCCRGSSAINHQWIPIYTWRSWVYWSGKNYCYVKAWWWCESLLQAGTELYWHFIFFPSENSETWLCYSAVRSELFTTHIPHNTVAVVTWVIQSLVSSWRRWLNLSQPFLDACFVFLFFEVIDEAGLLSHGIF